MYKNSSVIIYQACQTSKIPPIACSLQRIGVKSTLDSGDTTGRVNFFLALVGWLFFCLCVCGFSFSCALLVHLVSVSGKVMVSILPSFHFKPLAMKTTKNHVDQVMLKTH